jgi:proline iminopeptidase
MFGYLNQFHMRHTLLLFISFLILTACTQPSQPSDPVYFDLQETGVKSGGVKMIPIETPVGNFKVWTKRVGNNPRIKLLLLHGGPAATHAYFECFDSFMPAEGIEYYYYDQLGSAYSDQPTDSSLWTTDRFVEEVEQVRKALNLDNTNFYLLGHSWGGILATEYALKYQENLKGLIISSMMASCPDYGKYAEEVLGPQMDPEVLKEIKTLEANNEFDNPRYMELLVPNYYVKHVLRMDPELWPEPVNRAFADLNFMIYNLMQGPSEFGIAGRLAQWDRKADLPKLNVPTLTIGAQHDTMDPDHMKWMAGQVPNGRYLHCPDGSHMAMWDDQKTYMEGLIRFMKDVDKGTFKKD